MAKTIISSGHNIALLRVRNAIIQEAGYAVLTSKESAMILQMAKANHAAAVVLCSSIPVLLRANLARDLKKVRPNLPLIIITRMARTNICAGQPIIWSHPSMASPNPSSKQLQRQPAIPKR